MCKIIIPLLLICLTGCVITPSKQITTTIGPSKKEGMIVGTISIENRPFFASGYSFHYLSDSIRNVAEEDLSKRDKQNLIKILNADPDFKEDKKWYFLFNIVKKEGKYKFHKIEVYSNSGAMESVKKIPFKFPFEIEAGKIHYIGEINLEAKTGEIRVINSIERDRGFFKAKFPDLSF